MTKANVAALKVASAKGNHERLVARTASDGAKPVDRRTHRVALGAPAALRLPSYPAETPGTDAEAPARSAGEAVGQERSAALNLASPNLHRYSIQVSRCD